MPDEEKPETKKADGLLEIQKRILSLEAELKGFKGAEADNIKAIIKESIKGLEDELATLKLAAAPKTETEAGLFDWLGI